MSDAYKDPNFGESPELPYSNEPYQSYGEWNRSNGLPTNTPQENLRQYGSYVTDWYLNSAEGLTQEKAQSISQGLVEIGKREGLLADNFTNEDAYQLVGPSRASKEKQVAWVRQGLGEHQATQFEQGNPNDPYYTDTLNEALQNLVDAGELPFATITSKDGRRRDVIAGPSGLSGPFTTAFKEAVMVGAVDYTDAARAYQKISTVDAEGLNGFTRENLQRNIWSLQAGLADKESLESTALEHIEKDLLDIDEGKKTALSEDTLDVVANAISSRLGKVSDNTRSFAGRLDRDILNKAASIVGAISANNNGKFKFHEKDFGKNIRLIGGRAFAHPSLMVNKANFEEAIKEREDLKDYQKEDLYSAREAHMERIFPHLNWLFSETSATDSDWANELSKGVTAGKSKMDIMDSFMANPDNYSHFQNSAIKLGASVEAGVWGFVNMIGATVFQHTGAREYLIREAEEEARRTEVAHLFGKKWSTLVEAGSAVAPMIADALISFGLMWYSGGLATPFIAGAKATGTSLTKKGLAKSLITPVLRQRTNETVKETAERLLTNNIIKASSKDVAVKGIMPAIEAYNKVMSKNIIGKVAYPLTWANRSSGNMYTSVYMQLPEDMDHDTKHSIAIGAAMKAGLSTVFITSAFQKLGLGGFENAVLKRGINWKQAKSVIGRLEGNAVLGKERQWLEAKLKDAIKVSDKKLGGRYTGWLKRRTGDALSEGAEEGLDELVQSFVEAASLDEDRPMMEHINNALLGAKLGAIIGAGATPVMRAISNVVSGPSVADVEKFRSDEVNRILEGLAEADSPLAAKEFQTWARRQLTRDARQDVEPMTAEVEAIVAEAEGVLPEAETTPEPEPAPEPETAPEPKAEDSQVGPWYGDIRIPYGGLGYPSREFDTGTDTEGEMMTPEFSVWQTTPDSTTDPRLDLELTADPDQIFPDGSSGLVFANLDIREEFPPVLVRDEDGNWKQVTRTLIDPDADFNDEQTRVLKDQYVPDLFEDLNLPIPNRLKEAQEQGAETGQLEFSFSEFATDAEVDAIIEQQEELESLTEEKVITPEPTPVYSVPGSDGSPFVDSKGERLPLPTRNQLADIKPLKKGGVWDPVRHNPKQYPKYSRLKKAEKEQVLRTWNRALDEPYLQPPYISDDPTLWDGSSESAIFQNDPFVQAIIEMGGIMTPEAAVRQFGPDSIVPEYPEGQKAIGVEDPTELFSRKDLDKSKVNYEEQFNKRFWGNMPLLRHPSHSVIFKESGITPHEAFIRLQKVNDEAIKEGHGFLYGWDSKNKKTRPLPTNEWNLTNFWERFASATQDALYLSKFEQFSYEQAAETVLRDRTAKELYTEAGHVDTTHPAAQAYRQKVAQIRRNVDRLHQHLRKADYPSVIIDAQAFGNNQDALEGKERVEALGELDGLFKYNNAARPLITPWNNTIDNDLNDSVSPHTVVYRSLISPFLDMDTAKYFASELSFVNNTSRYLDNKWSPSYAAANQRRVPTSFLRVGDSFTVTPSVHFTRIPKDIDSLAHLSDPALFIEGDHEFKVVDIDPFTGDVILDGGPLYGFQSTKSIPDFHDATHPGVQGKYIIVNDLKLGRVPRNQRLGAVGSVGKMDRRTGWRTSEEPLTRPNAKDYWSEDGALNYNEDLDRVNGHSTEYVGRGGSLDDAIRNNKPLVIDPLELFETKGTGLTASDANSEEVFVNYYGVKPNPGPKWGPYKNTRKRVPSKVKAKGTFEKIMRYIRSQQLEGILPRNRTKGRASIMMYPPTLNDSVADVEEEFSREGMTDEEFRQAKIRQLDQRIKKLRIEEESTEQLTEIYNAYDTFLTHVGYIESLGKDKISKNEFDIQDVHLTLPINDGFVEQLTLFDRDKFKLKERQPTVSQLNRDDKATEYILRGATVTVPAVSSGARDYSSVEALTEHMRLRAYKRDSEQFYIGLYVSDGVSPDGKPIGNQNGWTVEQIKHYIKEVTTGTEFSRPVATGKLNLHIMNADKGTVAEILSDYNPSEAVNGTISIISDADYDWETQLQDNKESLKLRSVAKNTSLANRHANDEWNNNITKRLRDASILYSPVGWTPESEPDPTIDWEDSDNFYDTLLNSGLEEGESLNEKLAEVETEGLTPEELIAKREEVVETWMRVNRERTQSALAEKNNRAAEVGLMPVFLFGPPVEGTFPEGMVAHADEGLLDKLENEAFENLDITIPAAREMAENQLADFDLRDKYYMPEDPKRVITLGSDKPVVIKPFNTYADKMARSDAFAMARSLAEKEVAEDPNSIIGRTSSKYLNTPEVKKEIEKEIQLRHEEIARETGIKITDPNDAIEASFRRTREEFGKTAEPEAIETLRDLLDHGVTADELLDHLENVAFADVAEAEFAPAQQLIDTNARRAAYSVLAKMGVDAVIGQTRGDGSFYITALNPDALIKGHPIALDNEGNVIPPSALAPPEGRGARYILAGLRMEPDKGELTGIAETVAENTQDDLRPDLEKLRRVRFVIDNMRRMAISNGVPLHVVKSNSPDAHSKPAVYKRSGKYHKGLVYVNPVGVAKAIEGIESDSGLLDLSRSLFVHESAHIASTRQINKELFRSVINDTSDSAYEDIIDSYVVQEGLEGVRETLKSGLGGETVTFLGQPLTTAGLKEMLVEEKLRMDAERVLTGTTSEEQIAFLKTNPNWLRLSLNYLKNLLRKYVAAFKLYRNNSNLGVATKRVLNEMRAMRNSYAAPVESDPFNPDNPERDFLQLASMFGAEYDLFNPEALRVNYIYDEENDKQIAQKVPYDLLGSPAITQYRGPKPRSVTGAVPDFEGLHYWVSKPNQELIREAIASGAVDEAANNLSRFVQDSLKQHPHLEAAADWYPAISDVLTQRLGEEDAKLFPTLLAATSPNTAVELNFQFAAEALTDYRRGKFDSKIKKFQELRYLLSSQVTAVRGKYITGGALINTARKRGIIGKDVTDVKEASARWIEHYDLLPKRPNEDGEMVLYGMNSLGLLKALSGIWTHEQLGGYVSAKAPQFAMNIGGDLSGATIDVWAGRTLRRILWGGHNKRWRIPQEAETGVSNEDFALGQEIFKRAARDMGMDPANLQALAWFAEKQLWSDNNWTSGAGAAQTGLRESMDIFFPEGRKPRPIQQAKNIMKFIQAERLYEPEVYTQKDFDNQTDTESNEYKTEKNRRANHRRNYNSAKKLTGVSAFIKQRGFDPIRTANERVRKGFDGPSRRDLGGSVPPSRTEDQVSELYSLLGAKETPESESILNSLEGFDADYIRAVESGNMSAAEQALISYAKAMGFNTVAWHGNRKGGDFTIFDDEKLGDTTGSINTELGHFFATSKDTAQTYNNLTFFKGFETKGADKGLLDSAEALMKAIVDAVEKFPTMPDSENPWYRKNTAYTFIERADGVDFYNSDDKRVLSEEHKKGVLQNVRNLNPLPAGKQKNATDFMVGVWQLMQVAKGVGVHSWAGSRLLHRALASFDIENPQNSVAIIPSKDGNVRPFFLKTGEQGTFKSPYLLSQKTLHKPQRWHVEMAQKIRAGKTDRTAFVTEDPTADAGISGVKQLNMEELIKAVREGDEIKGGIGAPTIEKSHIWIIPDTSNIRSAELVVRDDAGNVIPPSQRFASGKRDIYGGELYSLEGSTSKNTSERQFDNFMATLSDEIGVSMNPDRPENVILGSLEDPEADLKYKGMHEAPTEGARMSYMDDDMYPSDIYSEEGARLYGHGGTDVDRDRRMHGLLMSVRGKPEAVVTVYRSVPSGAKGTISKGDWVSPDRQYAEHHGARTLGDDGYKILSKEVKAGELVTEGNSLYEFGYSPAGGVNYPFFVPDTGAVVEFGIKGVTSSKTVRINSIMALGMRKGFGGKALKAITNAADKTGTDLELTAQQIPTGPSTPSGMTTEELVEWYKNNGFVFEENSAPFAYFGFRKAQPATPEETITYSLEGAWASNNKNDLLIELGYDSEGNPNPNNQDKWGGNEKAAHDSAIKDRRNGPLAVLNTRYFNPSNNTLRISRQERAKAMLAIAPWENKTVPRIPSQARLGKNLKRNQQDKIRRIPLIGKPIHLFKDRVNPKVLKEGTRVAARIDIPSFNKTVKTPEGPLYAITVHEPISPPATAWDRDKVGTPIMYSGILRLTNVKFNAGHGDPTDLRRGSKAIAMGQKKSTLATVEGDIRKITEADFDIFRDLFEDDRRIRLTDWREVAYNPERSSEFSDITNVNNPLPVVGADEVIQVGSRVYARGLSYRHYPSGRAVPQHNTAPYYWGDEGYSEFTYSMFGAETPSDEDIENASKFSDVMKLHEIPLLYEGDYEPPKVKIPFWKRVGGRPFTFFTGVLDKRIQRLDDKRKFAQNAALYTIKAFDKLINKQVKSAYGVAKENLSIEDKQILSDATGSAKGATLRRDQVAEIDAQLNHELEQADALAEAKFKLEQDKIDQDIKDRKRESADQIKGLDPTADKKIIAKMEREGDAYAKQRDSRVRKVKKELAEQTKLIKEASQAKAKRTRARLRSENAYEAKVKRANAIDQVRQKAPELADTIDQLRRYLDDLSKKVSEVYGVSPDLQVRFDNQMGIYLTQSYKMFLDPNWADTVTNDAEFDKVREEAADFFEQQFITNRARSIYNETNRRVIKEASKLVDYDSKGEPVPISLRAKQDYIEKYASPMAEAEVIAEQELAQQSEGGERFGERMVREFIDSYRGAGLMSAQLGQGEGHHPLIDSLRKQKDIPEAIGALLGKVGPEETFENMYRTFVNLNTMLSNQNFLVQMVETGRRDGWLLTRDELSEKAKENPEKYGQGNYQAVRRSALAKSITKKGQFDPFTNYTVIDPDGTPRNEPLFGPKEFIDSMEKTFDPVTVKQAVDESSFVAQKLHGLASKMTGLSMGFKTLGSVGFYIRNIVSNMFFFGPSQGFINMASMTKELIAEGRKFAGKGDILDAEVAELTHLGIIGNEIRPSFIKEIYEGAATADSLIQELENHLDAAKDKGKKALRGVSKAKKALVERTMELSARVDAFYKIAYYKHELKHLERARDAKNGDKYESMTDEQLKQEASRKVLMTAQSYSQAPPLVKGALKSWYGIIFAPFLRFRIEVWRILLNTAKLGFEEARDSNPVIRSRGKKRLSGLTLTVGGLGGGLAYAMAWMFDGLGDEEDEANRASMPSYLRTHTFFTFRDKANFFGGGKDKIVSFDMTYLNPYSAVADPFLRAFDSIRRGNMGDAAARFYGGFLTNQFMDDQIVWGTVASLLKNKHPDTDSPIYEETDPLGTKLMKIAQFGTSEAVVPPTMERVGKGTSVMRLISGDAALGRFDPIVASWHELWPTRPHIIDPQKQLERFLRTRGEEMRRARLIKRRMKAENVSDKDIRNFARKDVQTRMRINQDIMGKLNGFEKMGLSRDQIFRTAKAKNYGKRRMDLLKRGYMERPVLTKDFRREMYRLGPEYVRRMGIFNEEVNKMPRFIPLD